MWWEFAHPLNPGQQALTNGAFIMAETDNTPSSRNRKATKSIDLDAGTVTFTFADGGEPLVVSGKSLPQSIQVHALLHGISQKVGDSYSGVDTPEQARVFAQAAVDQLMAGDWKQPATGGSGGTGDSVLCEALARASGHSLEDATAVVAKLDDDQRKALRKRPAVKAQIEAVKIERAMRRQKAAEEAAQQTGDDLAAMFG